MHGFGPSSYGDAFADVYDEWYTEVSDVEATVERLADLATGAPVLELGIGSGRLALPLAQRGVAVWGIDASAAMVERLRAKPGGDAVPVAIGDMADLDLSSLPAGAWTRFGVVFAACNTFLNLTTDDAQRRCLHRCREVLAPGGRVVIEAFVPDPGAPRSTVEARTVEIDRVILTATLHEPMDQVVTGQHIELTAGGVRLRPWRIRYLTPDQLDQMAGDAGLALEERWADWSGSTPDGHCAVHVSVYVER